MGKWGKGGHGERERERERTMLSVNRCNQSYEEAIRNVDWGVDRVSIFDAAQLAVAQSALRG